eukprot:557635-Amphidinium_carterae.1
MRGAGGQPVCSEDQEASTVQALTATLETLGRQVNAEFMAALRNVCHNSERPYDTKGSQSK